MQLDQATGLVWIARHEPGELRRRSDGVKQSARQASMQSAHDGLVLAHRIAVRAVAQRVREPVTFIDRPPRLEAERRERCMHLLLRAPRHAFRSELAADLSSGLLDPS